MVHDSVVQLVELSLYFFLIGGRRRRLKEKSRFES